MSNAIILVVEDEQTTQYVLQQLLISFDYTAHFVSSGEEALEAFAVTKYAAVLMDVSLPGMDGYDCTLKIREIDSINGAHTPIIALTGRAEAEDKQECLKVGMDDYMSKPFEPDDLRRMLLRWVYDPASPNLKVLP
jgi:two-component system sensor histidine kinase/response regulator